MKRINLCRKSKGRRDILIELVLVSLEPKTPNTSVNRNLYPITNQLLSLPLEQHKKNITFWIKIQILTESGAEKRDSFDFVAELMDPTKGERSGVTELEDKDFLTLVGVEPGSFLFREIFCLYINKTK